MGLLALLIPQPVPLSPRSIGGLFELQSARFDRSPTAFAAALAVPTALTQPVQHWLLSANIATHPAEPTIQVAVRHYSLVGTRASELRDQMNQQGPLDSLEERHYDARTDWSVRWSYHHAVMGEGCRVDTPTARVEVTMIYPQWDPPTATPQALVLEWQRYLAALQLHENGHRDNAIAAGRDVLRVLNGLPTYGSCQALDRAADAATQGVIRHHNQQDLDYDRLTDHGYSQGAVFPAATTALQ